MIYTYPFDIICQCNLLTGSKVENEGVVILRLNDFAIRKDKSSL